ncbi:USP6 N-terminal-like protein [Phlyctochytrium bullatum]|nr:USP6 N-terminal-like protein [Phlyctochytrium bullatum]
MQAPHQAPPPIPSRDTKPQRRQFGVAPPPLERTDAPPSVHSLLAGGRQSSGSKLMSPKPNDAPASKVYSELQEALRARRLLEESEALIAKIQEEIQGDVEEVPLGRQSITALVAAAAESPEPFDRSAHEARVPNVTDWESDAVVPPPKPPSRRRTVSEKIPERPAETEAKRRLNITPPPASPTTSSQMQLESKERLPIPPRPVGPASQWRLNIPPPPVGPPPKPVRSGSQRGSHARGETSESPVESELPPPPTPPPRKRLLPLKDNEHHELPSPVSPPSLHLNIPPPPPGPPPKATGTPKTLTWRRSQDPFFRFVENTYSKADRFGFVSADQSEYGIGLGTLLELENKKAAKWRAMAIETPVNARLKEVVSAGRRRSWGKGLVAVLSDAAMPARFAIAPAFCFTRNDRPAVKEKKSAAVQLIDATASQTFVSHIWFMSRDGESRISLRRIVTGLLAMDSRFIVSPGTVRFAAMLLLTMEEERVFLTLLHLYRDDTQFYRLSALHFNTQETVSELLYLHEHLLRLWAPRLNNKFSLLSIPPSDYATTWYSTLFMSCLPPAYSVPTSPEEAPRPGLLPFRVVIRLWDLFFLHGYAILPVIGVCLMKQFEGTLLLCRRKEDILAFLGQDGGGAGDPPKAPWPTSEADEEFFFRSLSRFWEGSVDGTKRAQMMEFDLHGLDPKWGGSLLVSKLRGFYRTLGGK